MQIMRLRGAPVKRWKGGVTREIYRDEDDFRLRISCAEIDAGEATFSDFSGYERILRIIEGTVLLERKDETVTLGPRQELRFSGNEKIKSSSTSMVLDFNVIYKPELYRVEFIEVIGKQKIEASHALIFALDTTVFSIDREWTLNKHEYLHLDSSQFEVQGFCIVVKWQNIRKLEAP